MLEVEGIETIVLMGLVWALGGTLDRPGRTVFDGYLRERLKKRGISRPFPAEGTIFDYYYDWGIECDNIHILFSMIKKDLSNWKPWNTGQPDSVTNSMLGILYLIYC